MVTFCENGLKYYIFHETSWVVLTMQFSGGWWGGSFWGLVTFGIASRSERLKYGRLIISCLLQWLKVQVAIFILFFILDLSEQYQKIYIQESSIPSKILSTQKYFGNWVNLHSNRHKKIWFLNNVFSGRLLITSCKDNDEWESRQRSRWKGFFWKSFYCTKIYILR